MKIYTCSTLLYVSLSVIMLTLQGKYYAQTECLRVNKCWHLQERNTYDWLSSGTYFLNGEQHTSFNSSFLHGCYGAFAVVVSTGINEIVSLYSFAVVSSLASFSFKLYKVVGFDTISVDAITVWFIVDIIIVVVVGDLLFCFALDFLHTHTERAQ